MCPGEPAAERTAGAALEELVRSRVTPEAGGYSGKPGADGPWPRPLLGGGVCVKGHLLCALAPPEPPPRSRACGVRRWHSEKAHSQSLGRAALGRWAAAAGAGRGPAPAVLPQLGLGTPGGRSFLGQPATSSCLSAHFLAPASVPPHPRPLASLLRRLGPSKKLRGAQL